MPAYNYNDIACFEGRRLDVRDDYGFGTIQDEDFFRSRNSSTSSQKKTDNILERYLTKETVEELKLLVWAERPVVEQTFFPSPASCWSSIKEAFGYAVPVQPGERDKAQASTPAAARFYVWALYSFVFCGLTFFLYTADRELFQLSVLLSIERKMQSAAMLGIMLNILSTGNAAGTLRFCVSERFIIYSDLNAFFRQNFDFGSSLGLAPIARCASHLLVFEIEVALNASIPPVLA